MTELYLTNMMQTLFNQMSFIPPGSIFAYAGDVITPGYFVPNNPPNGVLVM
jgi:hypothetical protein